MPMILVPPGFGISTIRTGPGKYDPDDMRFHSLYRLPVQVPLELLDCHPIRACRSSILLDLQPGIPHEHFRDVVRLALQPRLTHAAHSPRVDRIHQPGRPIPLAPPALPGFPATTRRSASVPRDRYSAPHGFSRSGSSLSPPVGVTSGRYLHTFHTRAWTGLMLPICRTPPGQ